MATPEATETEAAPKYSADYLRDPTQRTEVLKGYLATDIAAMSSEEVDAKLEQALRDGLVTPKKSGDEVREVDDTFTNKMALEPTIDDPGIPEVLENLKNRKLQLIGDATEKTVTDDLSRAGIDKGERVTALFEQAYRRGDVTLVETRPYQPAKGKPGTGGYVPEQKAKFEWRPSSKREEAIKLAFERVRNSGLMGPDGEAKFDKAPTQSGRRKGELDRQATAERAQAKAMYEQHQQKLAEDARRRIDEAERKAREGAAAAKLDLSAAQRSQNTAEAVWKGMKPPGARKGSAAFEAWQRVKPEISQFGPSGNRREMDVNAAHAEALGVDREAQGQQVVRERYQQMIDAEPDMMIKRQLRAAQEAAVTVEKTRQVTQTAEIGQIRAEAMNMVPDILTKAQDREHWVGETVKGYDENGIYNPRAMETASARLEALGIRDWTDNSTTPPTFHGDGLPFVEMNHGRVREAYYRVPNNNNVVVLERYNRKTGEFISQTIMTTHEPMRQSRIGNHVIPPKEVREMVDKAREADEPIRRTQDGTGIKRLATGVRDYASIGWNTNLGTIAGRIEGDTGPYAQRGITRGRRNNMNGRPGRHGGFWYWFWNR